MNIKKVIQWIFDIMHKWKNVYGGNALANVKDGKELNQVISVLKKEANTSGENFEQIWNKFYNIWGEHPIELYNIDEFMDDIKQKHFPKPARKTITIEFEAEKDNIITHHINLLKADLERRKDCPTVKYKIKELSQNSKRQNNIIRGGISK